MQRLWNFETGSPQNWSQAQHLCKQRGGRLAELAGGRFGGRSGEIGGRIGGIGGIISGRFGGIDGRFGRIGG